MSLAAAYVEAGFQGTGSSFDVCARRSCDAAAAYRLTFDGCGLCEYRYGPDAECSGLHTVCADCTAHLRVMRPAWLGPIRQIKTFTPSTGLATA